MRLLSLTVTFVPTPTEWLKDAHYTFDETDVLLTGPEEEDPRYLRYMVLPMLGLWVTALADAVVC